MKLTDRIGEKISNMSTAKLAAYIIIPVWLGTNLIGGGKRLYSYEFSENGLNIAKKDSAEYHSWAKRNLFSPLYSYAPDLYLGLVRHNKRIEEEKKGAGEPGAPPPKEYIH